MKVLVVDDDPSVVRVVVRLLEGAGHKTCWSYTGEGALELVRTERDIEVVLLDINLGRGIDGIEVARRLPRGLPLIIISGVPGDEIHARAHQSVHALSGALVRLEKPLDIDKLLHELAVLAGR